jgi:outer membrane protein assembly factor BamB
MTIRDKNFKLEAEVLQRLQSPSVAEAGCLFDPAGCIIVCQDYAPDALSLDTGSGWYHLSIDQQRACQSSFAAYELQNYIAQITGVTLPIEPTAVPATISLLLTAEEEESDGFSLKYCGEEIQLKGTNTRGLLYAVYSFLEAQGCRWYGLGRAETVIPTRELLCIPPNTEQMSSFPWRFFHSHLENRASAAMLDWFGKNKMNLWGGDNDRPGQRSRGIRIYGGNHWLQTHAEVGGNFDISEVEIRQNFLREVVELFATGHYKDVDILDYIGDDWGLRVNSPGMRELGNASDQDVFLLAEIQKALEEAYTKGTINRQVATWGWAYHDTLQPPSKSLPQDFQAIMGVWAMSDARFALNDPESYHEFLWPHIVSDSEVKYTRLPSNIEIWSAATSWPCPMGFGDYHQMARNFFLPAPLVSVLDDTIPKLKARGALYYSFMHIGNGYWGLSQPYYYLLTRMLWDSETDTAGMLAEMLRHFFDEDADKGAQVLFAVERAMLPCFWLRSHVCKRLAHVTLHDLNEPFWMWGKYFKAEELEQSIRDLETAREILVSMRTTERVELWTEQVEYALSMHRLYFHAIETYESARKSGSWHFSKSAARHFADVLIQLEKLRAIDLPRWHRNVHYFPRTLMEQTLIGPALERMSANLGIHLPLNDYTVQFVNPKGFGLRKVWTHGDVDSAAFVKGNYIWAQPYIRGDRIFITGQDCESSPERSILRCLDLHTGRTIWERFCEDAGYSALLSTYMGIECQEDGSVTSLFLRECHGNPKRPSALVRFDSETGKEIWRIEDRSEWPYSGNGAALVMDLDGDGKLEVIDCAVTHIAVYDVESASLKWRYDEQISICHGVTVAADIDGDGCAELVIGGEYNEQKGTSSLITLKHDGNLLWRSGGHIHDLGSTKSHVLDVDDDGHLEILHAGLELLGQKRLPTSDLYCWNSDGTLRYRVPFGAREVSLADFDGDGRVEAIAITSGRDGGYHTKPAIICMDAASGESRWSIPIARHYLDDDLRVVADFDGDGLPEALLFTAHQRGYGHIVGQPSWGDAYIVKGDGSVLHMQAVGGLTYAAADENHGTANGIVVATDNGVICRYVFERADTDCESAGV